MAAVWGKVSKLFGKDADSEPPPADASSSGTHHSTLSTVKLMLLGAGLAFTVSFAAFMTWQFCSTDSKPASESKRKQKRKSKPGPSRPKSSKKEEEHPSSSSSSASGQLAAIAAGPRASSSSSSSSSHILQQQQQTRASSSSSFSVVAKKCPTSTISAMIGSAPPPQPPTPVIPPQLAQTSATLSAGRHATIAVQRSPPPIVIVTKERLLAILTEFHRSFRQLLTAMEDVQRKVGNSEMSASDAQRYFRVTFNHALGTVQKSLLRKHGVPEAQFNDACDQYRDDPQIALALNDLQHDLDVAHEMEDSLLVMIVPDFLTPGMRSCSLALLS